LSFVLDLHKVTHSLLKSYPLVSLLFFPSIIHMWEWQNTYLLVIIILHQYYALDYWSFSYQYQFSRWSLNFPSLSTLTQHHCIKNWSHLQDLELYCKDLQECFQFCWYFVLVFFLIEKHYISFWFHSEILEYVGSLKFLYQIAVYGSIQR
jgi:hypothetical protein